MLIALKIFATIQYVSLAIAASTFKSIFDFVAGGILWFTHLSVKEIDMYKYPAGKGRIQPVGIIIVAIVMAMLGFLMVVKAVQELIGGEATNKMNNTQLVWLIAIMITTTCMKFLLWLYCRRSRNMIVLTYAKDHYFDMLTNMVRLLAVVLGHKFEWWVDQISVMALAIYTIVHWSSTVHEKTVLLVDQSASAQLLQKYTYLALTHNPSIKHVDTVCVYTFGELYFLEVDIELHQDLPLKEAHDIDESLQNKIEMLPEVERAFVHLDFECEHRPEHNVMSKLRNSAC